MAPSASVTLLLLVLFLNNGLCTLEITDGTDQVRCTGDLSCKLTDMWCIPAELEEAHFPVLVPTNMRSKTVIRCKNDTMCFPCVQVELDISVAFLSERMEDLEGDDCGDYYDRDDEVDEVNGEDKETSSNEQYSDLDSQNNGSYICANLFISHVNPTSSHCGMVNVRMPLSSVPLSQKKNSVHVGKVVYSCFHALPSSVLNITSYTLPRYHDELTNTHTLPAPKFNIIQRKTNTSIGIMNGTSGRFYHLMRFYKGTKEKPPPYTLNGNETYIVQHEDIVPCLCFKVWWKDLHDAVRKETCPFHKLNHEYVNNTWRHSNLSLNVHDGVLVYTFEARCNLTAEAVLCWKSQHRPACQELPHSRRNINAQVPQSILGIKLFHPSLCVQVRNKDRVWHTKCLPDKDYQHSMYRSNILVLVSNVTHTNLSLYTVGKKHRARNNSSLQMQTGDQTLEQRVLNVFMSNECEKLWSPNSNEAFYVCSLDKYTRRRWHMALMLSVVIACTALLFLILMKMELKKCLKWISADKSLDEIFKGRRVWILYSPDSPVYEKLVSALAASLKELRLNVVLDQWHRVEMCQVLPMPWYYQQKALVFKENGIIILLFSEGSRERFDKWCNKDSPELSALDPYSSFGATLNCVYPDFLEGKAAGRYVIANFELFGKVDIPQIFQAVPTFSLPSQLHKLLKEITGANRSKLRNKQLQLLSDKLSDKLQKSIKECHSNRLQQSVSNQLGSETSVSMSYDESVSRTMQPLI